MVWITGRGRGQYFSFGLDPEGFIFDKKKGKLVSAYGIVQGTKQRPHRVGKVGYDHWVPVSVQVDGMACEFGTGRLDNAYMWKNFVPSAIKKIKKYLGADKELVFKQTVQFDPDIWDEAPDEAKILGCDPDYCAWTMDANPAPDELPRTRTGAGHVHIGWGRRFVINDNLTKIAGSMARELDATLGVASVLWDDDQDRRKMYGRAGAFRPKSYGMEYRTLSNAWLNDNRLIGYVYDMSKRAASNMMKGKKIQTKDTEDIINENKVDDAKHWLREHNLPMPPVAVVGEHMYTTDDLRYVGGRLTGTIIRAPDNHPFLVRAVEGRRDNKTYRIIGDRIKGNSGISYRSDEVNLDSPTLGYTNFDGGCVYLSRIPKRRDWKQGLRAENMFAVFPINKAGDYGRIFGLNYSPLLVAFLKNYPTLTEALERVEDIYDSVAISPTFAIDRKYNIIYKSRHTVGRVSVDAGVPSLSEDFVWLTELFESETGVRSNA